jgi:hypothetical protein
MEIRSTRATLKPEGHNPRFNMNRDRGRMDIQTDPARLNIDSTEMRASIGIKTQSRISREQAERGHQDAREATIKHVENGNFIMDNMKSGGSSAPIADLAMSNSIRNYEKVTTFMPSARPEITMEGGSVAFNYIADKLNFEWDIQARPYMEFVPHSIEFNVTQYNEVIIEYVGDPIYVPPSANPNYTAPPEGYPENRDSY